MTSVTQFLKFLRQFNIIKSYEKIDDSKYLITFNLSEDKPQQELTEIPPLQPQSKSPIQPLSVSDDD